MKCSVSTKLVFANSHLLLRLVIEKEQLWQGHGCPEKHQEAYIALCTRSHRHYKPPTQAQLTEGTQLLQPTLVPHHPRPSTTPQHPRLERTHNTAAMPDPPPAAPPSPEPPKILIKCNCSKCTCSTLVELPARKCSSCSATDH